MTTVVKSRKQGKVRRHRHCTHSGIDIGRRLLFSTTANCGTEACFPVLDELTRQDGQTVHRTLASTAWNVGPSPHGPRSARMQRCGHELAAPPRDTQEMRFFLNNTSCLARSGKLSHALLNPSTSTRAAAGSPRSDAVSAPGVQSAHCDNCNSASGGVLHLHVGGYSVSKTRSIRTQCADHALPLHAASVRGCAPGI